MRKSKLGRTSVWIVLLLILSVGVALGVTAYFGISSEVVDDIKNSFSFDTATNFETIFKENLVMELVWIGALWILCGVSIVSPFAVAVLCVRGFTIGFAAAFIISVKENIFRLLLRHIFPQALLGVPLLTLLAFYSVTVCAENDRANGEARYFIFGILALLSGAAISFCESLIACFL